MNPLTMNLVKIVVGVVTTGLGAGAAVVVDSKTREFMRKLKVDKATCEVKNPIGFC